MAAANGWAPATWWPLCWPGPVRHVPLRACLLGAAAFMPFRCVTLLLRLNPAGPGSPTAARAGSNLMLTAASALFVVLLATEIADRLS